MIKSNDISSKQRWRIQLGSKGTKCPPPKYMEYFEINIKNKNDIFI